LTGILTKSSTGLIFAENAESYPAGWTHAGVGTASGITTRAHSGAGSFLQETSSIAWNNWPNGWANSDDDKLTQTVDVKSGANRVAKVFRALGIVGILFDDFPTNTLDITNKWLSTGNHTISNSIISIAFDGSIRTNAMVRFRQPLKIAARIKTGKTTGTVDWYPVFADNSHLIWLIFHFDGHLYIHFRNVDESIVDAGVYDPTAYHIYSLEWLAGSAKVYCDSTLLTTETTNNPADSAGLNYYTEFTRAGGTLDIDWVAIMPATGVPANMWKFSLAIGSSTLFDVDVMAETASLDNGFFDEGWPVIPGGTTGNQTVELKLRNASGQRAYIRAQHIWDDLVIMLDSQLKITSLLGGQKVELLDTGGIIRKTVTCPETGTDVFMDISDLVKTAYGFSGYFKVYDTDGISLLYTSGIEARWGGDIYKWIPNQSKCEIATNYTLIYRSGSGLSPTQATVTVTLTDKETGDKLNGKPIDWAAVLGTVNPTGGDTDSNGQASTIFTAGTSAGLGGVRASFAGDATYGPSSALQQIDIYYADPVIDASKDFQIFLEGQEMLYSEGDYKLTADFKPQPFRVVGPAFTASTGFWWAIEIYRKGTREFQGRILTRKRQTGTNPLLTITGVDNMIMLQRRVANRVYQDDPKLIIEDLLNRYPCGVKAGIISLYGSSIKLPATYENLYDALVQIKRITGWLFRLNADNTLDFAPSFGATKNITIMTGLNETAATHEEDASQVDSAVYVVGSAAGAGLVAYAEDATAQLIFGVIEETFLEKGITEQGTLGLRALEILNEKKVIKEIIALDWADMFAPGSYGPFDSLTVTDSDAGLSGLYQVFTITRKLLDANMASLQLTNRIVTLADAMQAIRNVVKDLGVQ
jgi:hypothetical protein